ncbi:efflux RND transporter periplasmic adaptor subunit [Methyloferula stellata]|uniref:efflux RND transporter periplasmic adaptor subunit n=1 Tax=Methyloferula stellata TaxID=876270 RepID=UPI00035D1121|nr:efflux RND transporter periplasmic adaptor subunit [Methyloferula stellata]
MGEAPFDQRSDEARSVTPLESGLWQQISSTESQAAFYTAWLTLQCRSIDGASRGLLMLAGAEAGVFEPAAVWPENAGKVPDLVDGAKTAILERHGVLRRNDRPETASADAARCTIAYPILIDETVEGAVAIALTGLATAQDPRASLRQLQWGAAWVRERLRKAHSETERHLLDQSRTALDLLASSVEHESFQASALAVVTELALRFNCTKVSLGFVRGRSIHVVAISHTSQFRRQMNLISHLTAAMNEAVDQRCVIAFPVPNGNVAAAAHAELSRIQADSALLTVPFFSVDRFVGAMTFERPRQEAFDSPTMQLLETVVASIGPVLDEKRRNDRWVVVKLGEALRAQAIRLLGPGHLVRKTVALALIAASCFFYFATDIYRVDADAQIEGLVRRAVVAAYDGFLREANVRAGDTVKKDQQLAALDDRDLALERLRWVTERQQRTYEYDKALAGREPAAINVTRSQIAQADAQIKLLNEQLSRITIRAPFDGLVVSGDLSQLIGASVNRGQVLFEIAPLDGYRVILSVDERQIGAIEVGQKGSLITNALPDEPFTFVVDKLTPIAEAKAGRNSFRVEGLLTENSDRLRPGMEGVAKIDIGRRRLIWIWTHSLVDWLRIWAWQYMP